MTSPDLGGVLKRVEALGPFGDRKLDLEIAVAFGWSQRLVTNLGLNGRTPGRYLWFPPYPNNAKPRSIPAFTGPRFRPKTAHALRALIANPNPNGSEERR